VDADQVVEGARRAGADAVMVYANSHVGGCYYPTEVGHRHAGLNGRDLFGEQLQLLHEEGIATCAYYSVNFNVLAWRQHPEWRLQPSREVGTFVGPHAKYAVCCPSNREFNAFQREQVGEIASRYDVDAFFFDMVFWGEICLCASCRTRFFDETGHDLPDTVDWFDPIWCAFQDVRERWLVEQFTMLKASVQRYRAIPVYLNATAFSFGWTWGASLPLLTENDLVGGDIFCEDAAWLATAHMLTRAGSGRFQYMTTISGYGASAARMRELGDLAGCAQRAALFGGQFLAIDAIEADGTVNLASYDALRAVFDSVRPFHDTTGGVMVCDVAVYWSQRSGVDFADNGKPLAEAGRNAARLPHFAAIDGALLALGQAGLAAGVISELALPDLADYPVLVLPDVHRLTDEEVTAFRSYVDGGGRLYASGHTSLVTADGTRHDDFLLADLFGARLIGETRRNVHYLKPLDATTREALAPARYLTHGDTATGARVGGITFWCPLLEAQPDARVLATLTQAFGDGPASKDNDAWASIHTDLPWRDTAYPLLVHHRFGAGEVIYSALPVEAVPPRSEDWLGASGGQTRGQAMFVHLIRALLAETPLRVEVDGHPQAWVLVRDDPNRSRLLVGIRNQVPASPPLAIPRVDVRLADPEGVVLTHVTDLRDETPIVGVRTPSGLAFHVPDVLDLRMLAVHYTKRAS
jgi:hypothetical protein